MAKLSAFADEVTESFRGQVEYLAKEKVGYIEPRFIDRKNIMDLGTDELKAAKKLIRHHGFKVSAIGSPVGKVWPDGPFYLHLQSSSLGSVAGHWGMETIHACYHPLPPEYTEVSSHSRRPRRRQARREHTEKRRQKASPKVQRGAHAFSTNAFDLPDSNAWRSRSARPREGRVLDAVSRGGLVFVVAHQEKYWRELTDVLNEISGVTPIVLQEQPDGGTQTIIEKFEMYARKCCYAIVILTPDDWVRRDEGFEFRARPNIMFELGWFAGHLGRGKIMMLVQEGTDLNAFSDFQGVLYKLFREHVSECFRAITYEMRCAGL